MRLAGPETDLWPAPHHRLADHLRVHVLLRWLALLLIRIGETATGDTWTTTRRELQRLHVAAAPARPARTVRPPW